MHERRPAGRSIVTRRAIIDIVQTAVQSSYGVTGLTDPSFGRRLLRWLGLARPGIRLSVERGLRLDLYLTVAYGVPVAEVARQVDSAVRYALRRSLGVEAAGVSIHVDGLRYQAPSAPAPSASAPGGPQAASFAQQAVGASHEAGHSNGAGSASAGSAASGSAGGAASGSAGGASGSTGTAEAGGERVAR